jgi:hypothetical protein
VKKCASCAKDLPEAALHCVFCGAKQPAPAVQPAAAKTAFGYSANEVMQELNRPRTAPRPAQPSHPQPATAATVFAPPKGSAVIPPQPPAIGTPAAPPGMGIHARQQITPQPLPAAPPPYLASQTAARAGHPIDPWKSSLRRWMVVFGALTLAAFVTPLESDPITFHWDTIVHGEGLTKLPPLIMGAVGVLSVLVGALPMPAAARGVLAAMLGLAGAFVPLFVGGMPRWQDLVPFVGMSILIPFLLVRNEYTDSLLPRVLITIGVGALLLPYLLPTDDGLPLVNSVKALIEQSGTAKLQPALNLGLLVIAVMSLLTWMPGPATGGATVFAWLLVLWSTLILHVGSLVIGGNIPDAIQSSPYLATMEWAPHAAYFVLGGYGLATVIGKQLE